MHVRHIAAILAGCSSWAWMAPALADTVATTNGQIYRGEVIKESERGVTLRDDQGVVRVFFEDEVLEVFRAPKTTLDLQRYQEATAPAWSDDERLRILRKPQDRSFLDKWLFIDMDVSPLILSVKGSKPGFFCVGVQPALRVSVGGSTWISGGFDYATTINPTRSPATVYTAPWGGVEYHLGPVVLGVGAGLATVSDGTTSRLSQVTPRVNLGLRLLPDSGFHTGLDLLYMQGLTGTSIITNYGGTITLGYSF